MSSRLTKERRKERRDDHISVKPALTTSSIKKAVSAPEDRRYGVNPSEDMNVQLMNVDGTEPNRQEK